jgi:hypothetical protein
VVIADGGPLAPDRLPRLVRVVPRDVDDRRRLQGRFAVDGDVETGPLQECSSVTTEPILEAVFLDAPTDGEPVVR